VAAILTVLAPTLVVRTGNAGQTHGEQKIMHVLNRLGFGARPGDVDKVKAMGLQKYIDRQLNPTSIDDSAAEAKVKALDVFDPSTAELFAKYPNPGALLQQLEGRKRGQPGTANPAGNDAGPAARATAKDAGALREIRPKAGGTRSCRRSSPTEFFARRIPSGQLQEVMVDFWQNHFNVFAGKAAVRWYIPSYERDVLRPNALGNFKDLLIGTAQHPAMLFYWTIFSRYRPPAQLGGNRLGNGGLQMQQILRNGGSITPQMRERIKQRTGATDPEIDQRIAQMRTNTPQPQHSGRREALTKIMHAS
jgi:uncharacterized protein (DUF1800 family)